MFVKFHEGVKLRQQKEALDPVTQEEERDEEISGAQFLCETVIRSLTLEEAPEHRPLRRAQHSSHKPQGEEPRLAVNAGVPNCCLTDITHLFFPPSNISSCFPGC